MGYHLPVRTLSAVARRVSEASAVPRRVVVAAVAGGLLLAVLAVWLGARLPGSRAASDLGAVLVAAGAAGTAAYAARHRAGRARRGWTLLALSSGVWALGQLAWIVRQAADGAALELDPVTAALVLVSTPLALAGLLLLPGARPDRPAVPGWRWTCCWCSPHSASPPGRWCWRRGCPSRTGPG